MSKEPTKSDDQSKTYMQFTDPPPNVALISRTSLWSTERPCDCAFRGQIMYIDRRTSDDPRKIPAYNGDDEWWYGRGENHRIENGEICRDLGWEIAWLVKVDDIIDFVKKHGCCVFNINEEGFLTIEIYDDYRE